MPGRRVKFGGGTGQDIEVVASPSVGLSGMCSCFQILGGLK